jgi:hypothetical protein
MKQSFIVVLILLVISSVAFSAEIKKQTRHSAVKYDKAPPIQLEKDGITSRMGHGFLAAPPQLNSVLIDSARNGYGYSSSAPKSIDIATDAISGDDYAGVAYRKFVPGDPNSGIIGVAELNITQGFEYDNFSFYDYVNNISPFGVGGRFPSFQAADIGPVPIWNQYTVNFPDSTESVAYLSYDFFGWGPSGGGFNPPEDWAQNSPPNISERAPWLGCTDIYKDANATYHIGGIWELDLNSGNYTFLYGNSADLNTYTWSPGIDPTDVGWTATDLEMNVPRFAWGTNGFGAWVSTGHFLGTGDDDFKLMLCTTNDYGQNWSAIQRFEFSEIGLPETITAADSIFVPDPNNPDTTILYTGVASTGITYDFDLIITPNNEIHVGCNLSWGAPVDPNDPGGSYYPNGLYMGIYNLHSSDLGVNWTNSRIWYHAGLLEGDSDGNWETTNMFDLGQDDAGNLYAGWTDRDRQHAVPTPYPRHDSRVTDETNHDVWASMSMDGGNTWSAEPLRITSDTTTSTAGLRLASRTKWYPQDQGKIYMVYQIADLTRPLAPPIETLQDHVQWYYVAEARDFPGPTAIEPISGKVIENYNLHQNYPNPFNPRTTIRFDILKAGDVELNIYNPLGQRVATLVNERLAPGAYQFDWNASILASGVYLYQLKTAEFTQVRKMILMK